jgi:hypothetical protein
VPSGRAEPNDYRHRRGAGRGCRAGVRVLDGGASFDWAFGPARLGAFTAFMVAGITAYILRLRFAPGGSGPLR